jgi:glycosyltransferase involved in cell wall biosynthesis
MAAGTPVVATCSGGPQEIIENGRSGLLVPVHDPQAMAEAVNRIAFDPPFAARLAGCALDRVRTRYTLQTMLTAYEKLFQEATQA